MSVGPDRLPLPDADALTPEQSAAVAKIAAGPRGALIGPFVPLLRSPELMTRLQMVGEYIRFASVLDDDLVEVVILCVARKWNQQFEWGFHQPIALEKGVPPEVVEDLAAGRRPTGGRVEIGAVVDLLTELQHTGSVADVTYERALTLLGEVALIEVVGTAGYYTTLAMVMNAARTPPPEGAPRLTARDD